MTVLLLNSIILNKRTLKLDINNPFPVVTCNYANCVTRNSASYKYRREDSQNFPRLESHARHMCCVSPLICCHSLRPLPIDHRQFKERPCEPIHRVAVKWKRAFRKTVLPDQGRSHDRRS